ncbi:hypothetical protein [Egbenema bharatensis]|uniref:hypothetical protein n=1 Tax=Egbenema bharatensis TaxID=3463334 RepID=UPI003A8695C5
MSSPKRNNGGTPANPQTRQDEHPEGACRPTFYMNAELLAAIESQSTAEDKKRSPFVAEVLEFLLASPTGEQLRENAQKHRRSLVHELESNLVLFNEHVPTDRIVELAAASQRHPDQMLVRLILLGLRVYERALARMEADIEGNHESPKG